MWAVQDMVTYSKGRFKGVYCPGCMKAAREAEKAAQGAPGEVEQTSEA